MKRQINKLKMIISFIIFLAILAGISSPLHAQDVSGSILKLEDNDELTITGILKAQDDTLYVSYSSENAQLPDSIVISNIILTYHGRANDTLIINEGKSIVFKGKFTNDFSRENIQKVNDEKDLVLYSDKTYTLAHGSKKWKLNLVNHNSKPTVNPEPQEEPKGEEGGRVSIWMIITLVILFVLCLIFAILFIKNRKKKDPNLGDPTKKIEEQIFKIYKALCPYGTDETTKTQLERILWELPSLKADKDAFDKITATIITLKDEILQKIEGSKETGSDVPPTPDKKGIRKKYAQEIIGRIKNNKNPDLQNIINQAEKDNSSSEVETVYEFIKILGTKKIGEVIAQPKNITREQLGDKENSTILVNWIIESMSSCGCDELRESDTSSPEKIFSTIAEKINTAEKRVEEEFSKRLKKEFPNLSEKTTDETIKKIKNKVDEANKLVQEKKDNEETITRLKREKEELLSTTKTMLDKLHSCTEALSNLHLAILSPCSDEDTQKCKSMEDRLREGLSQIVADLNTLNIPLDTPPATAKKTIQDKLIEIMSVQGNTINTICCYYAYSRLPFMTDTSRQSGIIFNRQNMSKLYDAINNLFVYFGISFDIPALFVMGLSEGDYKDLTGTGHSELDNLCSNSWTHIEKIDSESVPRPIIVDIVNVGYTVDGEKKKTSVLTH